jgi:hypothetical protein
MQAYRSFGGLTAANGASEMAVLIALSKCEMI